MLQVGSKVGLKSASLTLIQKNQWLT